MKVVDLSGRQHTWSLKGYQVESGDTRPRSSGHLACRALLKKLFPLDVILEEIPCPGENLFLDFFLPARKIAIEIQGRQHDNFVPFFQKTKPKFYQSQQRDRRKAEFCKLNGIKLVALPDSEDESEWIKKLI